MVVFLNFIIPNEDLEGNGVTFPFLVIGLHHFSCKFWSFGSTKFVWQNI
jgi:hypothetical protein